MSQIEGIPQPSAEANRLAALRSFYGRHEISDFFAGKLRQLESFDIKLILDDSGSMTTQLNDGSSIDPYGKILLVGMN